MWGAARAMAFREEVAPKLELTCSDSLCEDEDKIGEIGLNDTLKLRSLITVDEAAREEIRRQTGELAIDQVAAMAVKTTPKLKVHQPEPESKALALVDDIEFDEAMLAKMFANLAAHGMTLQDLAS
jgi:hypothetical protein